MDAFEQLVSEILWMEGYWVRASLKVELTKEEKKAIGRPSSPRWELDIVAYSGRDNLLRVVECKSYLDSRGCLCLRHDRIVQRLSLLLPANQRFDTCPIPSSLNRKHHRRDYCRHHLRGKASWHLQSRQAEARPPQLSFCRLRLPDPATTELHQRSE